MNPDEVLTRSQDRRLKDEVLTRSQDRRLKEEALAALKNLVAAPEVKDMIKEVTLGSYGKVNWRHLLLTKDGLVQKTGVEERCTPPYECNCLLFYHENKPEIVEPSIELVENYKLTGPQLSEIFAKLKA